MDGSAVTTIADLASRADARVVELDGVSLSAVPLHRAPKPHLQDLPEALVFSTLQSFVDYATSAHDATYLQAGRSAFVHVTEAFHVDLVSSLFGERNQRALVASAHYRKPSGLSFGQWFDPEWFAIMLQTHFEPTPDLERVQTIIGTLKTEAVQTVVDDGVSQTVEVKGGIVRKSSQEAPRIVTLKPYRTFDEVEGVESTFILRLRGGGGDKLPEVALFEADGGAWRLEAVKRIREWLVNAIADGPTVADGLKALAVYA